MTRDETLFAAALELPEAERTAYLERECEGDEALQGRVEALLAGAAGAPELLAAPLVRREGPGESGAGARVGRYRLLERIGEGGCGVVWMAEQEEPVRRRVAVKVIKAGMDTREVVARFEAERQALALMEHPNIARVFDGGTTAEGRPYFVMELVRGVPITTYCDERGLDPAERIGLFVAACRAVQHAHQKGIIHRDLKPSNILVTTNDGTAVPKVIDFGIAKAMQGRLTEHTLFTAFHEFIGTPAYMSPEQAELSSVDVDTRSDIYSLGVLLYELLAGEPPFDRKTFGSAGVDEIRRRIREVEPPRPSTRFRSLQADRRTTVAARRGLAPAQLAGVLKGDLDWIVMRCLEKDRARRYETANGLAVDLERHLRHEPVAARPPSRVYLAGKLIRRHRLAVGAVAAVVAALTAGGVAAAWQAVRATRAEHEQSRLRAAAEVARSVETRLRRQAEAQELSARRRAYAADINLLQHALADENLGQARFLLNRQRPRPGDIELRGWEWRYLWQFCQSEAGAVVAETDGGVRSVAVSGDGRWLAWGGMAGGAFGLKDTQTRQAVSRRMGDGAVRVAFVPGRPWLGVLMEDRRFRIWNVESQETVSEWVLPGIALGFGFSPDGGRVATAAIREDGVSQVEIWSVRDGARLAGYPVGSGGMTTGGSRFAVAPDFSEAAHAGQVRRLHLVNLQTGRERVIEDALEERIWALTFSPDSRVLAANGSATDQAIRLWDVATARPLGRLEGHAKLPRRFVFWPGGELMASAGDDQAIRIWDLAQRRLVRTLRGHEKRIYDLALLPDGSTLVSGSEDGTVLAWDVSPEGLRRVETREPVHLSRVGIATRTDNDGVLAVLGPSDHLDARTRSTAAEVVRIERWTGRRLQERRVLLEFPRGAAVRLADRGTLLAVSQGGPTLAVWDAGSGRKVRELELPGESPMPGPIFSSGERMLVVTTGRAGSGAKLLEWNFATGAKLREWEFDSVDRNSGVLSPDERFCVVSQRTRAVVLDLQENRTFPLPFSLGVNVRAHFSPDGRLLPATYDGRVRAWDLVTAQERYSFPTEFDPTGTPAAFSPDGARLIVGGSRSDAIRIWEASGENQLLVLPAPASIFTQIGFSPDGNALSGRTVYGQFFLWRAPSWAEIAAAEAAAAGKP